MLEELGEVEITQQPEPDKEGITKEERYMLRKVGLRMKAFLLLGIHQRIISILMKHESLKVIQTFSYRCSSAGLK